MTRGFGEKTLQRKLTQEDGSLQDGLRNSVQALPA